jgi:hypothetical protein
MMRPPTEAALGGAFEGPLPRTWLRSLFGCMMMVATQKQMLNDIVAAKIEIHMT